MGEKKSRKPAIVPIGTVQLHSPEDDIKTKFLCMAIEITRILSKQTRKKFPMDFDGWKL